MHFNFLLLCLYHIIFFVLASTADPDQEFILGNKVANHYFQHSTATRIWTVCVTDDLRSYFLNEIDGLQENDGILIVGSTNHLERLDPGIAKRPSRFDRKFFFPDPSFADRVQYSEFWRKKLADNDEIEFPEALVKAVANITDGFSFAYIQEAFVASLLLIAGDSDAATLNLGDHQVGKQLPAMEGDKDGLEGLRLWRVIKEQVKILRKELEAEQSVQVGENSFGVRPKGYGYCGPVQKLPLPFADITGTRGLRCVVSGEH